jgi:hypothetical protein
MLHVVTRMPSSARKPPLRALDRGVVDVAVQRLLEHALVNLDRVDLPRPARVPAGTGPSSHCVKPGIVSVIPRRREAIAEVTGGTSGRRCA